MQKFNKLDKSQLMDFVKHINVKYHLQIDVNDSLPEKMILKRIAARCIDKSFNLTLMWHVIHCQNKNFVHVRNKLTSSNVHYPTVSSLIVQLQLQSSEIVSTLTYLNQLLFSINVALPKSENVHFSPFYFTCCEFLQNLI